MHVELRPVSPVMEGRRIDEHADVVVLAGDIHAGARGLGWARDIFPDKPIVYVAGNHEFYDQHWSQLLDPLREMARKHEVQFLENDAWSRGTCVSWAAACGPTSSCSVENFAQPACVKPTAT